MVYSLILTFVECPNGCDRCTLDDSDPTLKCTECKTGWTLSNAVCVGRCDENIIQNIGK